MITETLFSKLSVDLDGKRQIFVSIIELAGNSAFDLLNARKPVSILEDSFGSTHLAGASEYHVTDVATLHRHMGNATSFRCTKSTQKNDSSSRSHAICKLRFENSSLPHSDDGLLYLIDLAGSEAARDVTHHSAERMKECREINASLSVLKDCIRGRANLGVGTAAKKPYVPFRQSSLTKVLKPVFDPDSGRSCKTVVLACVNPSFMDVGASKNTLRYAEMLRVPVPRAAVPRSEATKPSTWSNVELREWISKNSGLPEISADLLAPQETGKQLLHLPIPDFLTRCLRTPDVTLEQATAFQAKFWRLHVDSSRSGGAIAPKSGSVVKKDVRGELQGFSSRDERPEMAIIPFKERIRPGMIVGWNVSDDTPGYRLPGRNLVMAMAPEGSSNQAQPDHETSYRCSAVIPGVMPGAFELYPWQQVVVPVSRMEVEVLLQYDVATRYYYEAV